MTKDTVKFDTIFNWEDYDQSIDPKIITPPESGLYRIKNKDGYFIHYLEAGKQYNFDLLT
jgi:hypothetical protein